jgi:hypothetical protein
MRPHLYLCAYLCVTGASYAADDIRIDVGDCETGVRLVARGAKLTDVLKRLSTTLGFQLELADSNDSLVDVDQRRQAPELIAKLSPLDNLIVTQARDARCPGKYKIVKVWMLPKASQVADRKPSAPQGPHQLTDAERKQIRDREAAYRTAHGLSPVGDEDDASK